MNNALNIMKSRVLLYCILLVIVCSCTKTVKQSKDLHTLIRITVSIPSLRQVNRKEI